jgi:hypothetical protein
MNKNFIVMLLLSYAAVTSAMDLSPEDRYENYLRGYIQSRLMRTRGGTQGATSDERQFVDAVQKYQTENNFAPMAQCLLQESQMQRALPKGWDVGAIFEQANVDGVLKYQRLKQLFHEVKNKYDYEHPAQPALSNFGEPSNPVPAWFSSYGSPKISSDQMPPILSQPSPAAPTNNFAKELEESRKRMELQILDLLALQIQVQELISSPSWVQDLKNAVRKINNDMTLTRAISEKDRVRQVLKLILRDKSVPLLTVPLVEYIIENPEDSGPKSVLGIINPILFPDKTLQQQAEALRIATRAKSPKRQAEPVQAASAHSAQERKLDEALNIWRLQSSRTGQPIQTLGIFSDMIKEPLNSNAKIFDTFDDLMRIRYLFSKYNEKDRTNFFDEPMVRHICDSTLMAAYLIRRDILAKFSEMIQQAQQSQAQPRPAPSLPLAKRAEISRAPTPNSIDPLAVKKQQYLDHVKLGLNRIEERVNRGEFDTNVGGFHAAMAALDNNRDGRDWADVDPGFAQLRTQVWNKGGQLEQRVMQRVEQVNQTRPKQQANLSRQRPADFAQQEQNQQRFLQNMRRKLSEAVSTVVTLVRENRQDKVGPHLNQIIIDSARQAGLQVSGDDAEDTLKSLWPPEVYPDFSHKIQSIFETFNGELEREVNRLGTQGALQPQRSVRHVDPKPSIRGVDPVNLERLRRAVQVAHEFRAALFRVRNQY